MNAEDDNDDDNKHAKYAAAQQQQHSSSSSSSSSSTAFVLRRAFFYILLMTLLADCYASRAETMMHLTLWSYGLHMLYFELPLQMLDADGDPRTAAPHNKNNNASHSLVRALTLLLHGPSFSGAHALFAMYLWTLYANPAMEFQLAPPGRAVWLVYARAFWLHAGPVFLHWMDLRSTSNRRVLRTIYQSVHHHRRNRLLLYFWASVGGYFAMGLTWEQVNGDATGTYRIEPMSEETFVNVGKVLGVAACLASFLVGTKAHLLDKQQKPKTYADL